jgi:hypothetical protein
MKNKFCKDAELNWITKSILPLFSIDESELRKLYHSIRENYDDGFIEEKKAEILSVYLKEKGIDLTKQSHLGIDLPISYTGEQDGDKIMFIAQDPKRNKGGIGKISIGTPFSLGTKGGRETNRNSYWNFIEPFAKTNSIYITDVYKIYFKKHKDNEALANEFNQSEIHQEILKNEIKEFNPTKIITIGKKAKIAVTSIMDIQLHKYDYHVVKNGIEYFFVPHLSSNVLQNFVPIGNLYRAIGTLKGNNKYIEIGNNVINLKDDLINK